MDDPGVMATSLVFGVAAFFVPLLTGTCIIFMRNSPIFLSYHFVGSLCEIKYDSKMEFMSCILLILDWLLMTTGCEAMLCCLAGISEGLVSVHFILKHLR